MKNPATTLPAYEINGVPASAAQFYAAACEPRRSVAVEACAGAGKTWMLVSRIVRALLDGALPHEILAITFTKKAAGEMRERLQTLLQSFSQADDAQLAEALVQRGLGDKNGSLPSPVLRRQLSNLYQSVLANGRPVQIRTFHGWFAALLRNAPLAVLQQLQLPASYELLEDDQEARDLVWRRFYAALAASPQLLADYQAVVHIHGRHQTEKALTTALNKRQEFALADAAGVVATSVAHFTQQFPVFKGLQTPDDYLLADAGRWQQLADAGRRLGRATASSYAEKGAELEQAWSQGDLQGVMAALLTKENTARKFNEKIEGIAQVREAQQLVLQVLAARHQHAAWQHQASMAALTRRLLADYAALKRERGWVDMGDVERAAAVLLGDPVLSGWVQQRLDASVRHLLVDEFQDTSPLQWQALSAWLAGYAGSGAGDPPSVFLVGDPKQSIYRFRRAEPQVFEAAKAFVREGLGGVVLSCDHTWRNAPEVIQAVNGVMLEATAAGDYSGFRAHTTASTGVGDVVRLPQVARSALQKAAPDPWVWRDSLATPQTEAEDTLRTLEARQAAAWLAAKVRAGVAPGDIMVLSRKRAGLAPLQEALRALGIPAQVAEKTALGETCEVQDIIALLDVLVSPLHDLSLARALKSPLFGWRDDDLIRLALAAAERALPAGASDASAPNPAARRKGPGVSWFELLQNQELSTQSGRGESAILARWKAWVDALPPHDALQAIYADGDVLARYAAAVPAHLRDSVLANLRALPAAALQLGGGRFSTPYSFVRALKAGGVEVHQAVSKDAVRLLTIHGAKGLEADVVLLLDTDANPRQTETMSVLVDWPGQDAWPAKFAFLASESQPPACAVAALQAEHAARSREELNALYVALTRARKTLAVSSIEPHRDVAGSWWKRLHGHASDVDPKLLAAQEVPAEVAPPSQPAVFEMKILPLALVEYEGIAAKNIANSMLQQQPETPTPSHHDVRAAATATATATTDVDVDTDSSRLGQAMHRLLQWGRVDAPSLDAVAREFSLHDAQREAAGQMAQRILQGQGAWAWDARQLAWSGDEVELWFEGQLLRLDRLVQRRGSGQWWVLDHKSASQPEQDPALVAQMGLYRRAVRAMVAQQEPVHAAFLTAQGQMIELLDDDA